MTVSREMSKPRTRLALTVIVSCVVAPSVEVPLRLGAVVRAGQRITTSQAQARHTAQAGAGTIDIQDFLEMPMTGLVDGNGSNDRLLSRVNTLREEVGGATRFFVSDLNGPLYIVDKATKTFSVYLDFNGNDGKKGIFRRLFIQQGYGN